MTTGEHFGTAQGSLAVQAFNSAREVMRDVAGAVQDFGWENTAKVGLSITAFTGAVACGRAGDQKLSAPDAVKKLLTVGSSVNPNVCVELAQETGIGTVVDIGNGSPSDEYTLQEVGAFQDTPPRETTDSLTTAVAANDAPTALKQFEANLCVDPVVRNAYGHALSEATFAGVKMTTINPWLVKFGGSTTNIAKNAREAVPVAPRNTDEQPLTDEENSQVIEASKTSKHDAAYIIAALRRFKRTGFVDGKRIGSSYRLAGGGLAVDMPEVDIDTTPFDGVGNKTPFVWTVDSKSTGCIGTLAGDLKFDQRPEFLTNGCEVPAVPAAPGTPGAPAAPGSPNTPGGGETATTRGGGHTTQTTRGHTTQTTGGHTTTTRNNQWKPPVPHPPGESGGATPTPPEGITPHAPTTRQVAPPTTKSTGSVVTAETHPPTTHGAVTPTTNTD